MVFVKKTQWVVKLQLPSHGSWQEWWALGDTGLGWATDTWYFWTTLLRVLGGKGKGREEVHCRLRQPSSVKDVHPLPLPP